jgi:hypothetical protein
VAVRDTQDVRFRFTSAPSARIVTTETTQKPTRYGQIAAPSKIWEATVVEPTRYVIDPLAPLPKRWADHIGPIRVMGGPVEGYLMVRRPGNVPFVLTVAQLLNAERHPTHGPFTLVKSRSVRVRALKEGASE